MGINPFQNTFICIYVDTFIWSYHNYMFCKYSKIWSSLKRLVRRSGFGALTLTHLAGIKLISKSLTADILGPLVASADFPEYLQVVSSALERTNSR